MNILINKIAFLASQKTYQFNGCTVREYFDDNNKLVRREKEDSFYRNIGTEWFDEDGNIKETMHKSYFKTKTEDGFIESYKSNAQEYTRRAYTKIENGFKHTIDDFKSKSGKSYYNEFIYDLKGQLLRIISNGKTITI